VKKLALSLNFVYRVTQALAAHGYVHRDVEKRFRIGGKLLALCQPVHDDVPLTETAMPALRWLSDQSGEVAHLGIIADTQGLVIERVVGTQPVKFYVERGTRFPLHTSAPGKAMLAFLPEPQREELILRMDFKRYGPKTITNREEFRKHLADAKKQGWATDFGEHIEGHHCLGAAILDRSNGPVAALWITGPSQWLPEERIAKLTPVIKRAARMASEALTSGGRARA
jgi:DNA-binding IclR family transcriptional regulator